MKPGLQVFEAGDCVEPLTGDATPGPGNPGRGLPITPDVVSYQESIDRLFALSMAPESSACSHGERSAAFSEALQRTGRPEAASRVVDAAESRPAATGPKKMADLFMPEFLLVTVLGCLRALAESR
jgi:hypothetical protein